MKSRDFFTIFLIINLHYLCKRLTKIKEKLELEFKISSESKEIIEENFKNIEKEYENYKNKNLKKIEEMQKIIEKLNQELNEIREM